MDHVFALQGVSNGSTHMFAIATGNGQYNTLDKVQCEAHFIPHIFQVSVNISSSVIQVNPLANSTNDMDPSAATTPFKIIENASAALDELLDNLFGAVPELPHMPDPATVTLTLHAFGGKT